MESLKLFIVCLLVMPSVLAQTTEMTTELDQTSGMQTQDTPTGAPTTSGNIETSAAPLTAEKEATNAPVTTEASEAPGETEASEAPGETEASKAPGKTEASEAPGETEASEAPGETDATNVPGETDATEASGKTEENTEGPILKGTTEATEPEEAILTVTTTLNYPDDKIVAIGGGAFVTITASVEIVNGSVVELIDDMKVIVYAADSEMEEVSAGIELDVGSFNLTVGEAVSFDRLNATLNLEEVLCTTFTHVCVRVEPETNALWKIAAAGSTDKSCEEIECNDSGSSRLVVSGLLMALCLFISRLTGDRWD
eukprot:XP_011664006.1 PREDICTED: uncharacterized protein LOC105438194 isoform X1 [Strongylocentrotus purpuratus]